MWAKFARKTKVIYCIQGVISPVSSNGYNGERLHSALRYPSPNRFEGEQVHKPVEAVRYQSMDVAVPPDGPKLIEINTGGGFDLPQLASGRGFLTDEVLGFFQECGARLRGRG